MRKRVLSLICSCALLFSTMLAAHAEDGAAVATKAEIAAGTAMASAPIAAPVSLTAQSALLMEKTTGEILFEKNPDEKLRPASVTKVMSLLLIMRAIEAGTLKMTDVVTVSEEAAGMGGSQTYMEKGEQFTVEEMLKAIVVASGNDATVAMAEHVCGSEQAFVGKMNETAKALGMNNTSFINCTGLDADGHYTTARDIAIMSRELLKHEKIKQFTTIWMDSLRGGAFTLSSTNKLVKTLQGVTGLKTGSTSKALFCISATAKRGNMELIAVIMASPTSKERFSDASKLINYGFGAYSLVEYTQGELNPVTLYKGVKRSVAVAPEKAYISFVLPKGQKGEITTTPELPESLIAPVQKGQVIGNIKFYMGDKPVGETNILAGEEIRAEKFFDIFTRLCRFFLMLKPVSAD